jgi:hypothetical protein
MMDIRAPKLLILLLVTLFLVAQFAIAAHAGEYGNAPHNHNGKICTITSISKDELDGLAILPNAFTLPAIISTETLAPGVVASPQLVSSIITCTRGPPTP